jgi:hypothetical protein
MKKEVMEKWVAALRSGKYEQGKGFLNKQGKFCCLGVLCDIAEKEGVCQSRPSEAYEEVLKYGPEAQDSTVTPKAVQAWAGFSQRFNTGNPEVTVASEYTELLAELNDTGMKFDQIANLIEKQYEVL